MVNYYVKIWHVRLGGGEQTEKTQKGHARFIPGEFYQIEMVVVSSRHYVNTCKFKVFMHCFVCVTGQGHAGYKGEKDTCDGMWR